MQHNSGSSHRSQIAPDTKGRVSLVPYSAGIGFAFVSPWISYGLYAVVAVIWIIPDRRLHW